MNEQSDKPLEQPQGVGGAGEDQEEVAPPPTRAVDERPAQAGSAPPSVEQPIQHSEAPPVSPTSESLAESLAESSAPHPASPWDAEVRSTDTVEQGENATAKTDMKPTTSTVGHDDADDLRPSAKPSASNEVSVTPGSNTDHPPSEQVEVALAEAPTLAVGRNHADKAPSMDEEPASRALGPSEGLRSEATEGLGDASDRGEEDPKPATESPSTEGKPSSRQSKDDARARPLSERKADPLRTTTEELRPTNPHDSDELSREDPDETKEDVNPSGERLVSEAEERARRWDAAWRKQVRKADDLRDSLENVEKGVRDVFKVVKQHGQGDTATGTSNHPPNPAVPDRPQVDSPVTAAVMASGALAVAAKAMWNDYKARQARKRDDDDQP